MIRGRLLPALGPEFFRLGANKPTRAGAQNGGTGKGAPAKHESRAWESSPNGPTTTNPKKAHSRQDDLPRFVLFSAFSECFFFGFGNMGPPSALEVWTAEEARTSDSAYLPKIEIKCEGSPRIRTSAKGDVGQRERCAVRAAATGSGRGGGRAFLCSGAPLRRSARHFARGNRQ